MNDIQIDRSCCWNSIERSFRSVPLPYLLSSLIAGTVIYLIYAFFGTVVPESLYGYNGLNNIFLSLLLAAQLFGILYFLSRIRDRFGNLAINTDMTALSPSPIDQLRENFTKSKMFYWLVLLTFLPFLAIEVGAIYSGLKPFYYQDNPTWWRLLLDVYNNILTYFMLYLFAILLWMIFNISFELNKINGKPHNESIKIALLNADKTGGLKPVKELILWFSVYYFLIIFLAVLSNMTTRGLLLYEGLSLIMFWTIGTAFFLWGWHEIRNLLTGRMENEVYVLDEAFDCKRRQLLDLISKDNEKENKDQINSLSNALDLINKERDRILRHGVKPVDAKTFILFIVSSSLSLITILKTLQELKNNEVVMIAFNLTFPYFNGSLIYLNHYLSK